MISVMMVLEATLGGTRRHVVDLLQGLDSREFKLTFVYSRQRADATFLRDLPALAGGRIVLHELPITREISPWKDASACVALLRLMRQVNPEVLHLHGAKAGALGRLAAAVRPPRALVYTPHGGSFHKFAGAGGSAYLMLERLFAALTHAHFIGVSDDSCRQICSLLKIPENRVHRVYNGIAPVDARAMLSSRGDGRFVVLYPAVFLPAKGHLPFLDSLHRSATPLDPRVEIWLAGDGPLRTEIEGRIRQYHLGQSVKLLGFAEDMASLYAKSDMVLLPSTDEAFGYVALEAMQHGRLILASAVGGLRELIQHDVNGLFLQPADWADLGACLNRHAAEPEVRNRLGMAGMADVSRRFSLRQMVEGTRKVYLNALGMKA
jgi:glycosyltransferase involved in cell wall biosynthesis